MFIYAVGFTQCGDMDNDESRPPEWHVRAVPETLNLQQEPAGTSGGTGAPFRVVAEHKGHLKNY